MKSPTSVSRNYASAADNAAHGKYDSAARLAAARARAGGDRGGIAILNAFARRLDGAGSMFEATTGRYHLYLNKGCPFCHRLEIGRALLQLEDAISVSYVDDARDGRGWAFRETNGPDPVNGFALLSDAFEATTPGFVGHISVPVLWDRKTKQIVSTESGDILTDLATRFSPFSDSGEELYPLALRPDIDALNAEMHQNVNFGVYLVGLAQTQSDYDQALKQLFAMLDTFEDRLSSYKYLFGSSITTSDIRLFATLARFDVGYYPIFRANLRKISEMPALWRYARRLYRLEAFSRHTDFDRYKRDYVRNFPQLTPYGILPGGPIADWNARE